MSTNEFQCRTSLRVRWSEVDMQKIVFNGHYLNYIDVAIGDYWRAIGLPYPQGYVDRYNNDLYLRKATVNYLGPARYDDTLEVYTRVARLGRTSMTFHFAIACVDTQNATTHDNVTGPTLIEAELVYVNAIPASMQPSPLPEDLRARIRAYERIAPAE